MKMETNDNIEARKLVTPEGRVSFPHLFTADQVPGTGKLKYSVNLLFPKSDKKGCGLIMAALQAAVDYGKVASWGGKTPAKLQLPVYDGDAVDTPRPEEVGCYVLKARSVAQYTRPGVVDKNRQPIEDEDDVYAGCYGRASVLFKPYNTAGSCGVMCILRAFQKLKDGEPLAAGPDAAALFDDGVGEAYPDPEPKLTGDPDIDGMLG